MMNQKLIKRFLSAFLAVVMVMSLTLMADLEAFAVNAVTDPVLLENSEENSYEKITFSDFGIEDGNILNAGAYGTHFISDTLDGDLDEVLFQGKYLFPTLDAAKQFGNIYLGKAKYYCIVINQDSAGNIGLDVIASSTNKSIVTNKNATNLTATNSRG